MDSTVLVAIISLLGGFVTGVLTLWVAVYTGKIELKKRKPEVVNHGCRISGDAVYTYITGKRKQTPPFCPYLDIDTDDYICRFSPESKKIDALKMKEMNKNRCYLALFAEKYDLE